MSGMSGATVNIQVDMDVWCFTGKSSKKECLWVFMWIDMNWYELSRSMIFHDFPVLSISFHSCHIRCLHASSAAPKWLSQPSAGIWERRATTLKTLHVYNGMLQIALKKAISVPFLWKNSCFETFVPLDGSSKSWDLLFVDPWSFL